MLGKVDEMLEGILAMDWCPIQGDWDKLWLDGALTCSYITDLPLRLKKKKNVQSTSHSQGQSVSWYKSVITIVNLANQFETDKH